MSQLFYHYTDVNALISILSNEELWLSNVEYMNDYTERKVVFEEIYNRVEDPTIRSKLRHLFNLCIINNSTYAISFTESGDQLSQWRGYCPNDGGYSIGINFDQIEELEIEKPDSNKTLSVYKTIEDLLNDNSRQIAFESCTYSHQESFKQQVEIISERAIDSVKDITLEQLERMEKLNYSSLVIFNLISDQGNTRKMLDFFFRISKIISLYKDSSFHEENEYRLIYIDKPFPSKPFIRNKKSYPLPYVKAKFNKDAVHEIFIGPTKYEYLARKGVYYLLNSYNIKAKTFHSEIPFRD